MKKTVSMILCVLMLASCLVLYTFASEDTTAADATEATEDTTAAQEIERSNDLVVFNTDLISKPNPLMGSNGLNKSSGVSKKGEWEGYRIDIKYPFILTPHPAPRYNERTAAGQTERKPS